jgi:hypothetical protein
MSLHHRRCVSNGGTNDPANLSIVSKAWHRAYHILFHNLDPIGVATELQSVWYPGCKFAVVIGNTRVHITTRPASFKTQRKVDAFEELLFRAKGLKYTLFVLNSVWIDPLYKIERVS